MEREKLSMLTFNQFSKGKYTTIAEGKYLKYSQLLLKKSELFKKGFTPTSITVIKINKEIDKEMKKLGIVTVPSVPKKFKHLQKTRAYSEELDEGRMKELHMYIQQKKSAEWIAKKMNLDVKTVKALMSSKKY